MPGLVHPFGSVVAEAAHPKQTLQGGSTTVLDTTQVLNDQVQCLDGPKLPTEATHLISQGSALQCTVANEHLSPRSAGGLTWRGSHLLVFHQPSNAILEIGSHPLHQTGATANGNVLDFLNRILLGVQSDSLNSDLGVPILAGAIG